MNDNRLSIGSVVLSQKGRDKGGYFAVVSVGDGEVFIADGDAHKLASPKKKNVKHVSSNGVVLAAIAEKLTAGKKVFDSELKSALRQFNESNE